MCCKIFVHVYVCVLGHGISTTLPPPSFSLKNNAGICQVVHCLPELDGKTLFQKTPHAFVTVHRKNELGWSGSFHSACRVLCPLCPHTQGPLGS